MQSTHVWSGFAWPGNMLTSPCMSANAAVSTAAGTADKQHSRTWSFVPACNFGRKENIFSTISSFCHIHTTGLCIHRVCHRREITASFTIFRGLLCWFTTRSLQTCRGGKPHHRTLLDFNDTQSAFGTSTTVVLVVSKDWRENCFERNCRDIF